MAKMNKDTRNMKNNGIFNLKIKVIITLISLFVNLHIILSEPIIIDGTRDEQIFVYLGDDEELVPAMDKYTWYSRKKFSYTTSKEVRKYQSKILIPRKILQAGSDKLLTGPRLELPFSKVKIAVTLNLGFTPGRDAIEKLKKPIPLPRGRKFTERTWKLGTHKRKYAQGNVKVSSKIDFGIPSSIYRLSGAFDWLYFTAGIGKNRFIKVHPSHVLLKLQLYCENNKQPEIDLGTVTWENFIPTGFSKWPNRKRRFYKAVGVSVVDPITDQLVNSCGRNGLVFRILSNDTEINRLFAQSVHIYWIMITYRGLTLHEN